MSSQNAPMAEKVLNGQGIHSMDILNSGQVAGHYCNTLQHCGGFKSVVTALQLVVQKFNSLN
jgi:hypothetical protein